MILNRIISISTASWVVAVLLGAICPAQAGDEPQREMWEEPSHQLVFEQGNLRIIDIRIVPGVTSEFHSHYLATVYIRIQDALMQNQNFGGEWGDRIERPYGVAGALVNRADYVAKNTYHRVRNSDDRTFHLLSIVNAANPIVDIELMPASEGGGLLNNAWFAEHRIVIGPNKTSELFNFENDSVLVQYDNGPTHVLEDGVAHSFKNSAAAWSWHAADSSFQVVNDSNEPGELILIEVRE